MRTSRKDYTCIQSSAAPSCQWYPVQDASPKQQARKKHKTSYQQTGFPQTPQIIPPHTSISAQNLLSLHRSHTPSLHWTYTVCSLLQAPLQKSSLFFKVCLNYCLVHSVFCTYFLTSVCSLIRPSLLKVRYLEHYSIWGPTSVLLNENLHLNENSSGIKSWTLILTSIGLAK